MESEEPGRYHLIYELPVKIGIIPFLEEFRRMSPYCSIVYVEFPTGTGPGGRSSPAVAGPFPVVCQCFDLFDSGQIGALSWTIFSHIYT
jgi:hypothetical protein